MTALEIFVLTAAFVSGTVVSSLFSQDKRFAMFIGRLLKGFVKGLWAVIAFVCIWLVKLQVLAYNAISGRGNSAASDVSVSDIDEGGRKDHDLGVYYRICHWCSGFRRLKECCCLRQKVQTGPRLRCALPEAVPEI